MGPVKDRAPGDCTLCAENVERVWDDILECLAHVDTDRPGKLRMCAEPWKVMPRPGCCTPQFCATCGPDCGGRQIQDPGPCAGGDTTCGRCGYPARNQPRASIQKVKVVMNDYTRPIFESAQRAAEEVAKWPAWKANECRCTNEELSKFMGDILNGRVTEHTCYSCKASLGYVPETQPALCGDCDNVP